MTWRNDAACKGQPTELWFTDHPASRAQARAICRTCPVRSECLEEALNLPWIYGDHGIWGGLVPRERRILKTERRTTRLY